MNDETIEESPREISELGDEDGPSFADLGISEEILASLAERGITHPFSIQQLAIRDALEGHDICGKAQTGSGKTLAFGLPMIQNLRKAEPKSPRALILVPTRELASQVLRELEPLAASRGLGMVAIYGGASMEKQIQDIRRGVDAVVATPGRFTDMMERREIDIRDVELVILDEADQMADLGFLPQVDRILQRIPGEHQTLLFSATLDGAVGALIYRYMHDPIHHEVETKTETVDTMEHRFLTLHPGAQVEATIRIAKSTGKMLAFVRTKGGCDRLALQLKNAGVDAAPIHGGLRQQQREKTLKEFSDGKLHVLVATNVAARGIHVEGVELVLHYDAPQDHKTYLHRSGRTARAGEGGLVVTFVDMESFYDMKDMLAAAGLDQKIVSMEADDPRLDDLAGWDPPRLSDEAEKGPEKRSRLRHRSARAKGRRGSRR